ncbi:MAG: TolC family protein [Gemmatimonadota bacterium]|nr:TolC family protein [Gemmatimonadota bacterium]
MTIRPLPIVVALALAFASASAQAPARDTVQLGALQAGALAHDPRARELSLIAAQSQLRQRNIDAERRPSLSVESQAQYQSDVARIPITLPGVSVPVPPHDTYDAKVVAQQRLYDPTLSSRRSVEDAHLAESQSRLRSTLFAVRQNVNDLFFSALRAQSQMAELATTITDLEAQLKVAEARQREGQALPSEALTLHAELLRRRQSVNELDAARRASLETLADLTGSTLDTLVVLATPGDGTAVDRARSAIATLRTRPEYEQFARSRELLQRQEDARSAQDRPTVIAYGRAGYGRPGLNPLSDQFDSYWLAGVQLQWKPFTWGTTDRDREVLTLQRQVVAQEEQQFTESLRRGVTQDLASIDRLAGIVSSDDEIVSLRERITAETRARFAEGVVTSAEYVDKETDVLSARISRALHRAELAQARTHFLTTLGLEVSNGQ